MMNLITRAIVGAGIGYAFGKAIDTMTANVDRRQPAEKATCLPLYKLAHENSVAWFQSKLQDALDMLQEGDHAPEKRVLITNAQARAFRQRALAALPERHTDGGYSTLVGITVCDVAIKDSALDCEYEFAVCVEFKKVGGVIVPVAHLSDLHGNVEGHWYSYADAYNAMHDEYQKAMSIAREAGMVDQQTVDLAYDMGKKVSGARKVPEYIKKAPTVSMSELERECGE